MPLATLLLAIVGTVLAVVPVFFHITPALVGVLVCLLAVVTGLIARKRDLAHGWQTRMATAGLTLALIGSALGVLHVMAIEACVRAAERKAAEIEGAARGGIVPVEPMNPAPTPAASPSITPPAAPSAR